MGTSRAAGRDVLPMRCAGANGPGVGLAAALLRSFHPHGTEGKVSGRSGSGA